ncbi:MAG: hypothetical protein LBD48_10885 [Treponema sp.]|jgi:hypothetical protein|nr:hypothetical protein [Treponema sp.]
MNKMILVLAAICGILVSGCPDPSGSASPEPGDIAVQFTGLAADGSDNAATTKLTLTFSRNIDGLGAEDITLSSETGAVKGTLTNTGTGTYELVLNGISDSGVVTVAAAKTGYAISGGPKTVMVYYYSGGGTTPAAFTGLVADGSAAATTTKLTLTFDTDITGLAAGNIALGGQTGASAASLARTGTGTYDLAVTGITQTGTLTVSVVKAGYIISGGPKTVTVYYYNPNAVVFSGLTANGSAAATTTKLTLAFDKDIPGLDAEAITLSGSTGAVKGTLARTGTGTYDLTVTGITQTGTLTVAAVKAGYIISGGPKTVTVYYCFNGTQVTSAGNSGLGTLRDAITNAPANSTIVVEAGLGTISLDSALEITKNLTIQGNGVTLTRSASWTTVDSTSRLLRISGSGSTVNINRVHFKNGRTTGDGAAIDNSSATVNLESCVFSGNQASGSSAWGGAVFNFGTMSVTGCTFYNNYSAYYGGAISNISSGTLTLTGNLFYGNTAAFGPVVYGSSGTVTSGGYNVVDVAIGTGNTQSGWTAAAGDATVGSLGISGVPFNTSTFTPVSGLGSVIGSVPSVFPLVDFYGVTRTWPGAPGAVK